LASPVTGVDFVAVPSTDPERLREFYVETLGLRADEQNDGEFWVGSTCFSIYAPADYGMEFQPQRTAPFALHVDDVEAARKDLELSGVQFAAETLDTGVCHMAFFADPDGNVLMLHNRYAPYEGEAGR
jgi:catechol 2,3-dioxygenase-like lactoylglutathione lyase family enzyme